MIKKILKEIILPFVVGSMAVLLAIILILGVRWIVSNVSPWSMIMVMLFVVILFYIREVGKMILCEIIYKKYK